MLALVVDTSAHPRAARSWAMCYKCYDPSRKLVWANPCLSRLGETGSLGRD